MQNELRYQVALSMVPGIGPVHAKLLVEKLGNASCIFNSRKHLLERIEGIGTIRAAAVCGFDGWQAVEEEMTFMQRYKIQPLFLTDEQYPRRLFHCYDPPTLLYYSGRADLNAGRMVAVVGTRYKSDYGRQLTEALVAGLAPYGVTVVSGLALGIDAIAHKTALDRDLPTIGVLGHGLDILYPAEHKTMAKKMLAQNGGLLTEFRKGTGPDKHNFPLRNRIVAGMCDAVVVIESGLKGGSMITASLAFGYDRTVCAFPGRTTDIRSAGPNQLIRTQRATLITSAEEMAEAMNWEPLATHIPSQRPVLTETLSGDEQRIVQLLQSNESLQLEELHAGCGLSAGQVASSLLSLELRQVLRSLPGKRYALNYN